MPSTKRNGKRRKTQTGTQLYNRIYSDVKNLNKNFLPPDRKFLSDAEARSYASTIYQQFKELPKSKLRIGDIQETILKQYPKAKKSKKLTYKNLYSRILRATKDVNDTLPKQQQLTVEKRRKIASQLYPEFRLKPISKIKLPDLRKSVTKSFLASAVNTVTNPLAIPLQFLTGINYFEIDHTISQLVPECIDVVVNAGAFGSTDMFNTKNYSYINSGVRDIVEAIRKTVKENYDDAVFYGFKKLKDGHDDDLTPENYYIDFILNFNSDFIGDTSNAIVRTPKGIGTKQTNTARKILNERLKKLTLDEKSKRKQKRDAKKYTKIAEQENKKNELLKKQKQQEKVREREKQYKKKISTMQKKVSSAYKIAMNALQAAYKSGAITKAVFDREVKKLNNLKK